MESMGRSQRFEVIFVKASDRTLHWILRYIRWMHVNPFGHDQNGWDDPWHLAL